MEGLATKLDFVNPAIQKADSSLDSHFHFLGGRCTAAALATYTTTVEPIMQKLESAVTSNQFYEVIYALEIIKMLEG